MADRIDLLLNVNVEFLHYSHVVSVRGITNDLLIFSKKKTAEKLHLDDRVWKTWSRTLVKNRGGNIMNQKLVDVCETSMNGMSSKNNSLLCHKYHIEVPTYF